MADTRYQVLILNQISSQGLHRLPGARYVCGKTVERPDAILVRSFDMRTMEIPASVKAIGRAGAGTNNIPVGEMRVLTGHAKPVQSVAFASAGKRVLSAGQDHTLRLWSLAENLGSVESLVTHPVTMTHADVEEAERKRVGITDGLVRLSVGMEDASDLIDDLRQALEQV